MSALLRAEILKLRTTRTFVALTGSALALSMLIVVLRAALVKDFDERDVALLFYSDFTSLFIMMLGVMGMAGEWRHRTITSTVLAAPDRRRLLTAKVISYAVAGLLISATVTIAIMAVGSAILAGRDLPTLGLGELVDVLWRNLAIAAFSGAFGVCVGALVRNQVVAIVGLLMLSFAIEPALLGLVSEVGQFGPASGAPNGVQDNSFDADHALAPAAALLVMAGWIATLFAAGVTLLQRRDLT